MARKKTTGPEAVPDTTEAAQLPMTKRTDKELRAMRSDLTSRVLRCEDLQDEGKDMRRKFNAKLRKAQRERNSLARVLSEHEAAYPTG